MPVEGHEARLGGVDLGGLGLEGGEELVLDGLRIAEAGQGAGRPGQDLAEPGEDVAEGRLPRLVADHALDDRAIDLAAPGPHDHVAVAARATEQLARCRRPGRAARAAEVVRAFDA